MGKRLTREEYERTTEHYGKMIKWAKSRPPEERPKKDFMVDNIKESWSGGYCHLCDKYTDDESTCMTCPLIMNGMCCNDSGSFWKQLCIAITWEEWIAVAEKFLVDFKALPKRFKEK